MNLHFPVISYLHSLFNDETDKKFFNLMNPRFEGDKFIIRENRKRPMYDGWLLDHEGVFIELKPLGKFRKWPSLTFIPLLSWFFYLSFEKYQITVKNRITVKELKKIIDEGPKINEPWDSDYIEHLEFFMDFLQSQDESRVINQEVLDEWRIK